MPSSSDEAIEELCNRIRHLCSVAFSEEAEEELRNLAKGLAHAIEHHVQMAKSSLSIKRKAILKLDMAAK
jgi:hypothetical protein